MLSTIHLYQRKMSKIFGIFVIGFFIIGCNPGEKQDTQEENQIPDEEVAEKELNDEVMAIHDEVMPRMDELMRLKGKLQAKVDSIRTSEGDTTFISTLRERIIAIRKADSAMMTWMRQFKVVDDSVNHEQRMEYLSNEREKIITVREMMTQAIDSAQQFIY